MDNETGLPPELTHLDIQKMLIRLQQSEARLDMVVSSTKLGTWDYKPLTGELLWSKECREIYGLAPGVKVDFDLFVNQVHPADKGYVLELIQQAMDPKSDGKYDMSCRILRCDDGSERWVRSQGKVSFNLLGQVEFFIGTVLDITENRLAAEKGARLGAIIDSSEDAIISKTTEGIVTSWNSSAERTFGYTAEEMIGQPILKLLPPERLDEEPMILARLRNGERVEHFETVRVTKFNKKINVSLTISPIKDAQGNIIGLSKIARDITEKKQEELRKNDFIAMVSHELKTPLTSIRTYIQVLLARSKNEEDAFKTNALTRADVQAKKMTSMIQDFLSLARLEEGKIRITKEEFELHDLIAEIASDAQFLTSSHQVKLVDCKDIRINADRDKIGQVLINLLSNAIKYSPKGGTITIGCTKNKKDVKIYVSDEGIGINPLDQKRLFEKFYRVKDEKIKTISGFGIGLYLVAEILRYHDTEIKVESTEDVGSTFYFMMKCS
nr:PAS domain-containing sensor histidine kinase [Mucilaginibacter sp. L294]